MRKFFLQVKMSVVLLIFLGMCVMILAQYLMKYYFCEGLNKTF